MADKAGVLADREGLGSVSMCGCGVVSVNLGAFTLRMEPRAFLELEEMVREAGAELLARARLLEQGTVVSSMTH
ncbi:hypothetical protein [Granulicella sibirica]|uniref:Uncharacterized protein n=1 Tax=Granulicella sibirica TaxID=2479048 RepID=A0A4V1L5M9_9BACT|nr:hypothetical protein [Granulicella sibirica]RXH56324.1 hypothetical protein GRAN_3181 [Granulicella sibirica]